MAVIHRGGLAGGLPAPRVILLVSSSHTFYGGTVIPARGLVRWNAADFQRLGIDPIIEEHDKRRASNGLPGTAGRVGFGCFDPARGEVERIDLSLGQIVTARHVALRYWLRQQSPRVHRGPVPMPTK